MTRCTGMEAAGHVGRQPRQARSGRQSRVESGERSVSKTMYQLDRGPPVCSGFFFSIRGRSVGREGKRGKARATSGRFTSDWMRRAGGGLPPPLPRGTYRLVSLFRAGSCIARLARRSG